jgi:phosphate-selective porin OprO/OprP
MLLVAAAPVAAGPKEGTTEQRLEEAEELLRSLQQEVEELRRQQQEEAAAPAAKEDPSTFRVYWKEGVRFETKDKKVTARIGGRIQNDWAFGTQDGDLTDEVGDFKNGVEFRRARVYLEGTVGEHSFYKAQYDFAGGDGGAFKDVYMGLQGLPVIGNIRVGQYKEPFSIEELTSSNYITFMERAIPNALVPSRSTGIMVYNTALEQRMTWAGGYFRDSDDFGDNFSDDENVLTGRLTGLPIYEDDGRVLFHLGAAGRWRQVGEDEIQFRQRPENDLAPRYVDTGTIGAKYDTSTNVEFAAVYGPASLQGEYVYSFVDGPGSTDPGFDGYYIFGSYFLTGEHRPYKTDEGAFGYVKPQKNFSVADGTWGAWEVAARYSQLNLDDSGIKGGELRDTTVGLNWYLNANMRVMLNWVHGHRKSVGSGDLFGTRFQVFF